MISWTTSCASRSREGFTLIEVLTVIVILTMVTAALAVNLASASESARFHSAASSWRTFDARARLIARTSGTVILSLEDGCGVMQNGRQDRPIASIALGSGLQCALRTSTSDEGVPINASGRSADYELVIRQDEDRRASWMIHGLSGQMVRMQEGQ